MIKIKWHSTMESIQPVLYLVNNGMTVSQACKKLNLSAHYKAIQSFMNKNGLHSSSSKATTAVIKEKYLDEIIRLYTQDKYTLKALGIKYNVSPSTIAVWLKKEGISLRPMEEVAKRLKLDSNYFDKIDSCSKAYILGFLAADGYVTDRNIIGFGLKEDDIEVLQFIREQWKCENEIRIKPKKPHNAAILQTSSKHMAETLKDMSIIPRKTYQLNPKIIFEQAKIAPGSDLEKAFLLGYFDGDGGISHFIPSEQQRVEKHYSEIFNVSITGTKETCEYYYNFAHQIGFLHQRHPNRPVNNWTYSIGGRNQCKKLLAPLYSVKDKIGFFLLRKYELFQML